MVTIRGQHLIEEVQVKVMFAVFGTFSSAVKLALGLPLDSEILDRMLVEVGEMCY